MYTISKPQDQAHLAHTASRRPRARVLCSQALLPCLCLYACSPLPAPLSGYASRAAESVHMFGFWCIWWHSNSVAVCRPTAYRRLKRGSTLQRMHHTSEWGIIVSCGDAVRAKDASSLLRHGCLYVGQCKCPTRHAMPHAAHVHLPTEYICTGSALTCNDTTYKGSGLCALLSTRCMLHDAARQAASSWWQVHFTAFSLLVLCWTYSPFV